EVAYTSNIDEVEATSTNNEIFIVPMAGGTPKKISTSPGSDSTPLYSPDGKYIAWRSQARAGFEADKWRLFVQDRQSGRTRDFTEQFARSVGSFTWANWEADKNASDIYFSGESEGETPVWHVAPDRPGEIAIILQPPSEGRDSPEYHVDDLVFVGSSFY